MRDLSFHDGYASCDQWVHELDRNMAFEIENPFLREGFEQIKVYLAKSLAREPYRMVAELLVSEEGEVDIRSVFCEEIQRIDAQILDEAKPGIVTAMLTPETKKRKEQQSPDSG